MRDRQRILDNLEKLYRGELDRSAGSEGVDGGRLDFEFIARIVCTPNSVYPFGATQTSTSLPEWCIIWVGTTM